jgi:hypothetical protein
MDQQDELLGTPDVEGRHDKFAAAPTSARKYGGQLVHEDVLTLVPAAPLVEAAVEQAVHAPGRALRAASP